MKNRSGIADPLTLTVLTLLALAGGVFGASFKPLEFLRPKPPTEELTKLQGQLTAAQAEAAQARKDKDAAVAAERAKADAQVRSVQEEAVAAALAVARVPPAHQGAEVKLTARMVGRVNERLTAILGELPKAQQEAMVTLINSALSDKQAEIDAADAKLAAMDAEFAIVSRERDEIKATIPVLEQKAATAQQTALATQALVTEKTNQVKAVADALDAKAREAGSLSAQITHLFHIAAVLALLYAFAHFLLPSLAQEFPASKVLSWANKTVKSLTSAHV